MWTWFAFSCYIFFMQFHYIKTILHYTNAFIKDESDFPSCIWCTHECHFTLLHFYTYNNQGSSIVTHETCIFESLGFNIIQSQTSISDTEIEQLFRTIHVICVNLHEFYNNVHLIFLFFLLSSLLPMLLSFFHRYLGPKWCPVSFSSPCLSLQPDPKMFIPHRHHPLLLSLVTPCAPARGKMASFILTVSRETSAKSPKSKSHQVCPSTWTFTKMT